MSLEVSHTARGLKAVADVDARASVDLDALGALPAVNAIHAAAAQLDLFAGTRQALPATALTSSPVANAAPAAEMHDLGHVGGVTVNAGLPTIATGQVWFGVFGGGGELGVGHFNNNGSTFTEYAPASQYSGHPAVNVVMDTAAGYYFTVNADLLTISAHKISDGSLVETLTVADVAGGEISNAIAIDPVSHLLYVGRWGTTTGAGGNSGIVTIGYNPANGDLNNNGAYNGGQQYLIHSPNSGTHSPTDVRSMFYDQGTHRLYFVDNDNNYSDAQFTQATNGVFVVDTNNPGAGAQQLTQDSQFHFNTGADAYARISSVAVNDAAGLIYFTTYQTSADGANHTLDGLWRMSISGGPATLILGNSAALHYVEPQGGLVYDAQNNQLFLSDGQVTAAGNDRHIVQLQLTAGGTALDTTFGGGTGVIGTYGIDQLVGHVADPNAYTSGLSFNALPILGLTGTSSHVGEQNVTPIDLSSILTTADADGGYLASATVKVSGGTFSNTLNDSSSSDDHLGYIVGNSLATTGTVSGITLSYNSSTETLTLTGYATLATYQTVLSNIGFSSTGDNPTNYGSNTTRTITWSLDDGTPNAPTNGQNTGTSTITIDAVNDAAVITGANPAALTETNAGLSAGGTLTITDPDTLTNNMVVASVTASGTTAGLVPDNATLLSYLTLGSSTTSHVANATASTDTFSFSSGSEAFNYLAPGQTLTLTYVVNGTASNDGTSTGSHNVVITINGTNDAPAGADATLTAFEDTARVFTATDFGFTDVDGGSLQAVKFTTIPGAGQVLLNGVAVTAGQSVLATEINAGHLTYLSATDASGTSYASLTFQVQDNQGIANGGVDLDQTANTLTFNVTAVNDAPAGADVARTILEDNTYIFGLGDFSFSDTHDSPANSLLAVKITTLPGAGALTLNGNAVNTGDFVLASEISAGHLVFTPAANGNGAGYGSFTFQVQDNGGTANGGVDTDPTANAFTLNVTSVNDAPSGASNTVTTLEDNSHVFATSEFGFSDTADGNTLLAVKIGAINGAGSLTLNGVAVTAGQSVSASEISLGHLVFTPAANGNGAGYGSFTFQVQDNGGTSNGGVDTDPTTRTMTVDVTSVNDAPSAADKHITTLEDTGYTFSASDFGFSDSDGNSLAAVKIDVLPTGGSLTLNGSAVSAGQLVAAADIGGLVFTPAANLNGPAESTITFQVQDDGGTLNGGVDLSAAKTITFDVTPVNDAPTAVNKTITTLEDTGYTFSSSDFGFSDSDGNSLQAVKIDTINGGSLTLNGNAVGAGDSVAATDLSSLVFTPAANANGPGVAGFTFRVQDNGGTANGGVDTSTVHNITFDVTSVNDAPTGADKTIAVDEDDAYTFTASDFGFSDNDGNNLAAVKIGTIAGGALSLNGNAVNAGDSVAAADLGNLVFTPTANANGAGEGSFTFQVQDDGGTANGGVDLSAAKTITFDVTSVNDAPSAANNTLTTLEDTAYAFTSSDFGFSDSDGNSLLAVKIGTVNGGSLSLNGNAVVAGDSVAAADLSSLMFTPAANANGPGVAGFSFQVQDDGGTANGGVDLSAAKTITFDVTPVNDAPTAADKTISTNEDQAYTFSASDFGFSDSDGNNLQAVKITTLPGAGNLTLNGSVVAAGDLVQAADIGNLVWYPPGDGNGAGLASFTFQVQDDGGTANGGVDLSTTKTITFDVASVNDDPVVNAGIAAHNVYFDDAFAFFIGASAFADVDGDTLTYSAVVNLGGGATQALPAWLTFDGATGKFTGTPPKSDIGVLDIQVTASDGHGGSVATDFNLTIVGNQTINGTVADETLRAHNGDDVINGNGGHDTLIGSDGNDTLTGGSSADALRGGAGDDVLRGGGGGDNLNGGSGNDVALYYDSATGVHIDLLNQANNAGGAAGDMLTFIERIGGSSHDDVLIGGSTRNWFKGANGDDSLVGSGSSDTLRGGDGADTLHGGGGHDLLIGGAGADTFDFSSVADSGKMNSDLITDFSTAEGDQLDLSLLDGDAGAQLTFIGTARFDGLHNEVRYVVKNGETYVSADLDGDKHADFQVRLAGAVTLHAGDLVL